MVELERLIARRRQWEWFVALLGENSPNVIQPSFSFTDRDSHADWPDQACATVGSTPRSVTADPQRERPAAQSQRDFGSGKFVRP